jgi:hypothetical protein
MTIKDTHDILDALLEKSQSGFLSPGLKDVALDFGSMSVYSTYVAQVIENMYVHSALDPFRKKMVFTQTDFVEPGVLTTPADMEHVTGFYAVVYNNASKSSEYPPIKVLKHDEIADALQSQIRKVDAANPIAYVSGPNTIDILPKNVYNGVLHYLKRPAKPKFNYTLSGRETVYNPTGSVDLEWRDGYMNLVIFKALEFLGVNVNRDDVVQYAMRKTATNQGGDKA